MIKLLPKILLIGVLSIFTINIIVKCNEAALVKVECHSDDCETESSKGSDCAHCFTLKNVITPSIAISEVYAQQISYSSYKSIYDFYASKIIYHPPRA